MDLSERDQWPEHYDTYVDYITHESDEKGRELVYAATNFYYHRNKIIARINHLLCPETKY